MLNNLNLRKRIFLGYMAPLLLMVGVCLTVIWNTRHFVELSNLTNQTLDITDNLQDAQLAIAQMQRATRSIILANDERSHKGFERARVMLNDRLEALRKKVMDPGQLEVVQKIAASNARLLEFMANLQGLVAAGKTPAAVELYRSGVGIALGDELDKLVGEFQLRENEILKSRQSAEDQALESLQVQVLTLTAAAVLLALLLGWWIAARISQALTQAIGSLSRSSAEIAATVNEHEHVVTQQAVAVNQTSTTIDELGASARQTATQAEAATEASRQALQATQEGVQLANQVSERMAGLKQSVNSVSEQILLLSEQAGQIGAIAKVVGELAVETNMLALNAAVEAAHAGVHGKGFAVVAAEVRKLADQSKKSAERAHSLVAEIQKASSAAVMVTEQGGRTTEEVAEMMAKAVAVFSSISSNANSVTVSAQQMQLNNRQHAAALGQVTVAMKSLAAGSTQIAAGTEQTRQGVAGLNSVAQSLQAMV
jgi:methyl-accepting chemotaxis protein